MTGERAPSSRRPAVFLDRDGTVIADVSYISRPEDVALLPGVAEAIARLNREGMPVVVVSNQSGIGRGYFTHADYERVQARVDELLEGARARLDAVYICPHAPGGDPCACRKPGTSLFRRAGEELGIDLARSWYVGDRWRDVAPAEELGGRGVLVPGPGTPSEEVERARARAVVVDSLHAAVSLALGPLDAA